MDKSCAAIHSRQIGARRSYHRGRSGLRALNQHLCVDERRGPVLTQRFLPPDLNLGVFPPWYLYYEIDNPLVALVGVERDVVPEGYWVTSLLKPDPPILTRYKQIVFMSVEYTSDSPECFAHLQFGDLGQSRSHHHCPAWKGWRQQVRVSATQPKRGFA